jgi:hypothetical protein
VSAALLEDYRDRIQQPQIRTASDISTAFAVAARLPLFEFPAGGRTIRLKRPVALRVGMDEGTWFVENEALSLFGHGRSIEEAVAEFIHDLGYLWCRYRALGDEELGGSARKLKALLASLTE